MIKFYSSSGYRAIRDSKFLILPSETTLYTYMVPKREAGINQIRLNELSRIASSLPENEREVSIIFDEMALQPNVNFDPSGEMTGFAANKENDSLQLATSMLCFMVQGLRKNFHEIASFYPVHNLDANFLQSSFFQVIYLLMKAGFKPIMGVCDNHATNRKMYRNISGKSDDQLMEDPSCPNPFDSNEIIILSHDPVHILKCIRNNWFRKPVWHIKEDQNVSWKLLQNLLEHEQDMPIRKAHNLSQKGINYKQNDIVVGSYRSKG